MDLDKVCPHENFEAIVAVHRLTKSDEDLEVEAFHVELTINCICGEKFRFNGVKAGLNPKYPTCSVDEFTLNIPIRPASADPDFGLGIPGYAINYRGV